MIGKQVLRWKMRLRFGTLVNYSKGRVRVQLDELNGLETPWIPLLVGNACKDKSGSPIDFGAQVACIMDDAFEQGVCLGCTYTDVDPCPTESRDKEYHIFSDGTNIEYDRKTHTLTVDTKGKGRVLVNAETATVKAKLTTVEGDAIITDNLTVQKNINCLGGVNDKISTMQVMREIFNNHDHPESHGDTGPPNTKMV
jgi:phage baseplate assembly protein V